MKSHRLPFAAFLLSLAVVLGLAPQLSAQTTWVPTASATYNWNLNSNWSPATFPDAAGAVVNVNNNIAGAQTINLPVAGITLGTLNLGDSDALSGFTIGSNTLTFQSASSGGATQLNTSGTSVLNSTVALGGTSSLTITASGASTVNLGGPITTNGNNITYAGGTAATNQFAINGNVVGAGTITNNSNAIVTFGSGIAQSFTGKLVANKGTGGSNTGSFTITNASLANAAEFVINGAILSAATQSGGSIWSGNGSALAANPGQRFTQNRITLNAGSLTANGQALTPPGEIVSDTVANFNFNSGYSVVSLSAAASTAGTRLIASTLERSAGATGFVRSTTLAGTARFTVGNINSLLIGGGGAETTTTMSILPWLVAANTNGNASTGADFATSGANGIRALVTAEYATTITAGASSTNNVKIGAVSTLTGGTTTINSLNKTSSSTDNLGSGQTLTVSSGGVLFAATTGGIGVAGNSAAGTLNFGSVEGVVWSRDTQSNGIGSIIAGSGGFTKAGGGTLTITGNNSYSGLTYVSSGTLIVGDGTNASHLGTTGNVSVANGAILSLMNNATISDTAILTLENFGLFNGKLTLATGINETVGGLFFGTLSQAAGTWGSTTSAATFKNDTYFSGNGILTVVPEPATWVLLAGAGTFFMAMRRRRE